MKLDIYQVDAFASGLFEGNPAAVCLLENWLDDVLLQAIAMEMNLSETAFLVLKDGAYHIRWFTPTHEVNLCGHATLASAHVLFEHYHYNEPTIQFVSKSGPLAASREKSMICLDFPTQPITPVTLQEDWAAALGGQPLAAYEGKDLIITYSDASEIEILEPDMAALKALPFQGVCVTAPGNGNGFDFVARYFAPAIGIDEDPVTGSAYTQLTPYYAEKTGKSSFIARQASRRGGNLQLQCDGNRVLIAGQALTAMQGVLHLPTP
ncbi:putative isomerase YddE [Thalassocella blandensis]|nr:putative isomerase YddE [Thalassocella blandensis]